MKDIFPKMLALMQSANQYLFFDFLLENISAESQPTLSLRFEIYHIWLIDAKASNHSKKYEI
jgi:hypothetical protein